MFEEMFPARGSLTGTYILLILVSSLLGSTSAQVEICGHSIYDVESLKRQPTWFAIIKDPSQCAGGSGDSDCTVKFSVCGHLPPDVCGDGNSTGFCQVIDRVNPIEYDTGKQTFIVREINGISGFQFRYKDGSSFGECTVTETIVIFQCSKYAEWDAYDPDVSRFVDGFLADIANKCLYLMTLDYSGACITEKPIYPHLCQFRDYDIQTLSEPATWVATVPAKDCYHSSTGEDYCNFFFSFCKNLPHGQCFNSSFCQAGQNPVSFGVFNKNQKIFENEDGNGFTITYRNGTITTNCPDGLFSTLVFTCNKDAHWKFDPDMNLGNITQYVTAEPTFIDCEYIVRFNYSGACPNNASEPTVSFTSLPSGPTVSPTLSPSGSPSLVLGWIGWTIIAILIFFGVVGLYFVIGFMIQAIRGKKGLELIPNHDLWGTVLACRFISCCKKEALKYDALLVQSNEFDSSNSSSISS